MNDADYKHPFIRATEETLARRATESNWGGAQYAGPPPELAGEKKTWRRCLLSVARRVYLKMSLLLWSFARLLP